RRRRQSHNCACAPCAAFHWDTAAFPGCNIWASRWPHRFRIRARLPSASATWLQSAADRNPIVESAPPRVILFSFSANYVSRALCLERRREHGKTCFCRGTFFAGELPQLGNVSAVVAGFLDGRFENKWAAGHAGGRARAEFWGPQNSREGGGFV